MLNTMQDCHEELMRIEAELNRLTLERDHVVNVLSFLQNKNRYRDDPLRPKVLNIIKENPGVSGRQIRRHLGNRFTTRQITHVTTPLRREGIIENQGGVGLSARWYFNEVPKLPKQQLPVTFLHDRLYNIVKENPGNSNRQIMVILIEKYGNDYTYAQVTNGLSYLRRNKETIENRSQVGAPGTWYIKE